MTNLNNTTMSSSHPSSMTVHMGAHIELPVRSPSRDELKQTMLSSEQAAVAFNLPFYYFRNPYKRKQLQIPHYYINKLVRYRLDELRFWHAQLGEILRAQSTAQEGGVAHA